MRLRMSRCLPTRYLTKHSTPTAMCSWFNFTSIYNSRKVHTDSESSGKLKESKTIVKLALTGNFIITIAKFTAWFATGSSSMLSETIHSVVDCGNQALLLIGLQNSQSHADQMHPYGYGNFVTVHTYLMKFDNESFEVYCENKKY